MKKVLALAIIVVGLLSFLPMPTLAMTGSGTAVDPYVIYNVTDLQDMSLDLTAYYVLNNTIDASDTYTWNWDAGRGVYEGFVPVGGFSGHFDGQYYQITDLYIDLESSSSFCVGLFGSLVTGAHVGNVSILSANITAYETAQNSQMGVAVLVGCIGGTGVEVENVRVSGNVVGKHYGANLGVYTICGAGGVVGYLYGGTGPIHECFSEANVEGYSIFGNKGAIAVGGFVGQYRSLAAMEIINCYARGDVYGHADVSYSHVPVGGFVGERYYGGGNSLIYNSYSTGAVSGVRAILGGFIGENYEGAGGSCTGLSENFWDVETSGQLMCDCDNPSQIYGESTANMKMQSTFTGVGWNFSGIWSILPIINDGYPYFAWWGGAYGNLTGAVQMLWFQPDDIIHGTTLPDRADADGAQDGVITWGANPAGIGMEMSGFYPYDPFPEYVLPEDIVEPPQDVVGPSGQPRWTKDLSTLTTHPFYPIVSMISDQTSIPVELVWTLGALFILLVAMAISYKYAPHQIITALVGGGLSAFFYHMCIFPFWVIFIFVLMAIAIVISEKSPTVS